MRKIFTDKRFWITLIVFIVGAGVVVLMTLLCTKTKQGSDLMPKENIKALVYGKKYKRAAQEYWKWFNTYGDEDAFKQLSQKLPKEALSEELRNRYLIEGAARIAQKQGAEKQKYQGNLFILVRDNAALTECVYAYHYSFFSYWSTVFRDTIRGLCPTHTFRGHRLASISSEGFSIPYLTHELIRQVFPAAIIPRGDKKTLYCIDTANPDNLLPVQEY